MREDLFNENSRKRLTFEFDNRLHAPAVFDTSVLESAVLVVLS